MRKKVLLLLSSIFLFFAFMLQTNANVAFVTPAASNYVRPLCEYQKNGETHYCCKDTTYSACSASEKCGDINEL